MELLIYTQDISPHQLPFASRVASRMAQDGGALVFYGFFTQPVDESRQALGWNSNETKNWIQKIIINESRNHSAIRNYVNPGLRFGLNCLFLFNPFKI